MYFPDDLRHFQTNPTHKFCFTTSSHPMGISAVRGNLDGGVFYHMGLSENVGEHRENLFHAVA
jgi:hypothetical protein